MPQKIEVSAKPIDKPALTLPSADRLTMKEVDWMILTIDTVEEELAKLEKSGKPVVFFALTDKGYENLGLNLSNIRAHIQQQKEIIAAYDRYYKASSQALDEANKEIKDTNTEIGKSNAADEETSFFKGLF